MGKKRTLEQVMKKRLMTAETLPVVILLTLSGGFQDAYTYLIRGGVFANAQTGNIVLMSSHIFDHDFAGVFRYLIPVVSFAAGVFVSEQIGGRIKYGGKLHWRQLVILIETILLFIVGLLPASINSIANSIVSFSCAMQVQSFRKVNGYNYASTMCIGNMRSGMESLSIFARTGEREYLRKSGHYFLVILVFAFGAGLGSMFSKWFGKNIIWVSAGLLGVAFLLMFFEEDELQKI